MSFAFDVSPHEEVCRRSEEIYARAGRRNDALRRASPEEHVELFGAWIDVGMPAWAVAPRPARTRSSVSMSPPLSMCRRSTSNTLSVLLIGLAAEVQGSSRPLLVQLRVPADRVVGAQALDRCAPALQLGDYLRVRVKPAVCPTPRISRSGSSARVIEVLDRE